MNSVSVPTTFRLWQIFEGFNGSAKDYKNYIARDELEIYTMDDVNEKVKQLLEVNPETVKPDSQELRSIISDFYERAYHSGLIQISDLKDKLGLNKEEFQRLSDIVQIVRETVPKEMSCPLYEPETIIYKPRGSLETLNSILNTPSQRPRVAGRKNQP